MPRVPYDGGIPEIEPSATPPADYQQIQTNSGQFGAQVGEGLQQLGAGALKAGEFYDQAATEQAYTGYQHEINNLLYGDPKKPGDVGFMGLQGEAAMKARPNVQSRIEQLLEESKGGLITGRSQGEFDRVSRRLQAITFEQMGRHYEQQAKVWGVSVSDGGMAATERSIANTYNDNTAFENGMQDMRGLAVKRAQLSGHDPNGAISEADSRAVQARINGALARNDYGSAQGILDKYGNLLDDKARATYGNHLRARSDVSLGNNMLLRAQGGVAPPSRGSGYSVSTEGTGVGHIAPKADRIAFAREYAASRGINPDAVLATMNGEGLNRYDGDGGTSFGDFQLHVGGGSMGDQAVAAGINIRDPNTWRDQTKFAIDQMAANRDKGPSWYAGQWHGAPAWAARSFAQPSAAADRTNGIRPPLDTPAQGRIVQAAPDSTPPVAPPPGMGDLAKAEAELAQNHARTIVNLKNDPRTADNPTAYGHAIQQADREFRDRQMVLTAQKQAITEARNAAADGYVQRMMKPQIDPAIVGQIADDPHLDASSRENLWALYQKHTKQTVEGDTAKYGSKFFDFYKRVTAPDADPNKIRDPSQIYALAVPKDDGTQDLTLAGVDKLKSELQSVKSPEKVGETKMRDGALAYAKHQLSFEADYGSFKLRDPKGEDAFNVGFLPAFFQHYEKGITEGKSPAELLKKENIDAIVAPFKRTDAQRARDMIEGGADAPGGATPAADVDMKSQAGIVSAYQRGKISRDQASQALIAGGFAVPAAPAAPTVPMAH